MHEVVPDFNAQSPRIVPGVAGAGERTRPARRSACLRRERREARVRLNCRSQVALVPPRLLEPVIISFAKGTVTMTQRPAMPRMVVTAVTTRHAR